ncbi:hypothetical protein K2V52_03140 [Staphylococcus nepalensis]|uniref:hypothetical protein n=1 Tax=Staphylococcus nepalensis TaxID=214473 RepID=UPI001E321A44|nr:hypothetical protein [Staphylococcus nepalensis]MCD8890956.1 hypothetical protein [Staphylococcus nepalensis]
MWYYKKWNKPARWIVTVVILLAGVFGIFDNSEEKDPDTKTAEKNKTSDKKETASKEDTKDDFRAKNNKEDKKTKEENTTTQNTTKEDKNDKKDDEVEKKEVKETSEKAKKTKKQLPKEDKTMSVQEYQGVVRSYQSQIQLAGDDLMKLENEINDNGKTTNKGKDLLYAISGTLESSSLILDGAKNDVIPPSEFKQEHKNLKEADNYFQTAAKQINNFEETENPEDLNNALEQIQTGVDNADISIRNILEN